MELPDFKTNQHFLIFTAKVYNKISNAIIFVQVLCHSTHKSRTRLIYKSKASQLDEF